METPIKVAFMSVSYGSQHMAFVCDDIESMASESNKFEAIVEALVAAGRLELVDIEKRRSDKILSRGRYAPKAEEPVAAEPAPIYIPDALEPF